MSYREEMKGVDKKDSKIKALRVKVVTFIHVQCCKVFLISMLSKVTKNGPCYIADKVTKPCGGKGERQRYVDFVSFSHAHTVQLSLDTVILMPSLNITSYQSSLWISQAF